VRSNRGTDKLRGQAGLTAQKQAWGRKRAETQNSSDHLVVIWELRKYCITGGGFCRASETCAREISHVAPEHISWQHRILQGNKRSRVLFVADKVVRQARPTKEIAVQNMQQPRRRMTDRNRRRCVRKVRQENDSEHYHSAQPCRRKGPNKRIWFGNESHGSRTKRWTEAGDPTSQEQWISARLRIIEQACPDSFVRWVRFCRSFQHSETRIRDIRSRSHSGCETMMPWFHEKVTQFHHLMIFKCP
jgi:hypothetical protein